MQAQSAISKSPKLFRTKRDPLAFEKSGFLFSPESISLPSDENAMSRRYLSLIQHWIPFAMSYYQDWPVRPECGHFFGGVFWYGQLTSNVMKILALAATSPEYDAAITGCPRDDLRRIARKCMRFLCFTHDTGPADCVRPAKGLGRPEPAGTKWGERGLGFFRESQCGRTVYDLNIAAALLQDILDAETWQMLIDVNLDYLGRFEALPPRHGVYHDTQTEENGWTANGLSTAHLFLSQHPKAAAWAEHAKKWMFCTSTMPRDFYDQTPFADDKSVSELCLRTFTTLPDGLAENHAIVHPNYLGSSISFMGFIANNFHLFGQTPPPHLFWHRKEIYAILQDLSDGTTLPHRVQGMDWPYFAFPEACLLHAIANMYFKDSKAAYLERRALDLTEKVQATYGGRYIDPDVAAICHGPQDPALMWERQSFYLSDAYLMHRLHGVGAEPCLKSEYEQQLPMVRHYPHGGILFHKHPKGQISFSWRNETMVLPLTRQGILLSAPARGSMLARIAVAGHPESTRPVALKVFDKSDRVAAVLIQDRAGETVRQQVFFASLPDGNSLIVERLRANTDVTVESVQQGFFQIMNERYVFAQTDGVARRTLYYPAGAQTFRGFPSRNPDDDVLFELEYPAWINVDDQMSFIFKGAGKTTYRNRRYYETWRGIVDEIILSEQSQPRSYRKDDVIGELITCICPEQAHGEADADLLKIAATGAGLDCVWLGDFLCCANFSEKIYEQTAEFRISESASLPIFPGESHIRKGSLGIRLRLDAREAQIRQKLGQVRCDKFPVGGALRIDALQTGAIYMNNDGLSEIQLELRLDSKTEALIIKPHQTVRAIRPEA